MTPLHEAEYLLRLSLRAADLTLGNYEGPRQRVLAWLASELERLAGEAYRLADEAGDDPSSTPDTFKAPIPGFDT